jgi:hypothetical protein
MTEDSVSISITINVGNEELKYQKEVPYFAFEENVQGLVNEIGLRVFQTGIHELDNRIAATVPETWRNLGTEGRWLTSSLGTLRYKRRVYVDEHKVRQKPIDELLGMKRYSRMSGRVLEMGSYLASNGTYRNAADQLSWLLKTPISHSSIQRMAWTIGNRIADGEEAERKRVFESGEQQEPGKINAQDLYGGSDGVWVHLQHEKRRSAEVRVTILSTGRKQIGKDRFCLENKHGITTIGLNSEKWQERVLLEADLRYNLKETKLLISGGDGSQWVRHTFDRLQVPQEYVLDRFHLQRTARLALGNWEISKDYVSRLKQKGFSNGEPDLRKLIQQSSGRRTEKLKDFYRYVHNNQDGLLDLEYRGYSLPTRLGAIEGNVDKLVVHRMKGRGCSWRLPGLRAMLALCRNANQLKYHSYQYLPLKTPVHTYHRLQNLEVKYLETYQYTMPIFQGPHQNEPWVKSLHFLIHGR